MTDPRTNRYESALNRIANLGMDAPAFGPDPAGFYRDQLMTAIGTAARALKEGAVPALQATPPDWLRLHAESPEHHDLNTLDDCRAALQATGEPPHE